MRPWFVPCTFLERKINITEHASQLMKMLLELFAGSHDENACQNVFWGEKVDETICVIIWFFLVPWHVKWAA